MGYMIIGAVSTSLEVGWAGLPVEVGARDGHGQRWR